MYLKYKVLNKLLHRIIGILLISWGLYQGYLEFYPHKWRIVTPTDAQVQKYSIKPTSALALYQLMKDTHEILTQHNIDYWITGGSLLGAARHKGIIPFDDDLDIGIDRKDEIKLQETFSIFRKLRYQVRHKRFYSICNNIGCLDIFIYHPAGDRFTNVNLEVIDRFPNDYFQVDEIFPLKKYQFGKLEVYGPNEYKPYLDRQYPEWDKYAIIQQPHNYHYRLSGIEKKTKFILTPNLLKPAMPTSPLKDRTLHPSI